MNPDSPIFIIGTSALFVWAVVWTAFLHLSVHRPRLAGDWSRAQQIFAFIISGPFGWVFILVVAIIRILFSFTIIPFWNWLGDL